MDKKIDIELLRNKLLIEKNEIEKKLKMLDEVEQMSNDLDINNVNFLMSEINVNNKYTNLKIVKSCELFFNENSDKYFKVKDVFQNLKAGGVNISERSGYTIISQTLSRLETQGFFITKKEGKIKYYKKKKKEEDVKPVIRKFKLKRKTEG